MYSEMIDVMRIWECDVKIAYSKGKIIWYLEVHVALFGFV
jgi:hypothetical protein